ncbi:Flagellar hook protein FlgE [Planctomycetes bacterium Pan216]|uniref:Flagellar hook protein FlgE n=1 Tax=Kolteria novifilia TaxID=2527975 RepID=A0A518BBF2_9BACT|nr:Flagellar hook protein FlgE [Planctomycetes bacterium Pan216]
MGIARSLDIAITGLNTYSTDIEIIGNNIANVNSTAYKEFRAEIVNSLVLLENPGTPVTADTAGSNPIQFGLGVEIGAVTTDFSIGPLITTGISTDVFIDGAGFLVVEDAFGQQFFTRNGALQLDANGDLSTAEGLTVQGFQVDADFNITDEIGNLNIPIGTLTIAGETTTASLEGAVDPTGEIATDATILDSLATNTTDLNTPLADVTVDGQPIIDDGSGAFTEAVTITYTPSGSDLTPAPASIILNPTDPLSTLTNFIVGTLQIDTDLEQPAGNEPGATILDTGQVRLTGNLGTINDFSVSTSDFVVETVADGTLGSYNLPFEDRAQTANGESAGLQFEVFDNVGDALPVTASIYLDEVNNTGSVFQMIFSSSANEVADGIDRTVGMATLAFDTNGNLTDVVGNEITITRGGVPQTITIDVDGIQALAVATSQIVLANQDGFPPGTLEDFAIEEDGVLSGLFSNGQVRPLGQIVLAQIDNPSGLLVEPDSLYSLGPNSNVVAIGAPNDVTGGLLAGALEGSNVDVTMSLVDLIVASTAFVANTRTVATSQDIFDALIALPR